MILGVRKLIQCLKEFNPCDLLNSLLNEHSLSSGNGNDIEDELQAFEDKQQEKCEGFLKSVRDYLPALNCNGVIAKILADPALTLECLWIISTHSLANLQQYLLINCENENVIATFTENLTILLDAESLNEFQKIIVSDLISSLIKIRFSPQTSNIDENIRQLQKVSGKVLDSVSDKILTSFHSGGINNRIHIHEFIAQNRSIDIHTLQKYYASQILFFLRNYEEKLSLFQVLNTQNKWRCNNTSPALQSEIFWLFSPFTSNEVGQLIKEIVEQPNVNWKLLLIFLSHFLVLYSDGSSVLEDLVNNFICEALNSGNEDNVIISFILARQACSEGNKIFMCYSDWFHHLFTLPVTKKSFALLMTVLSNLVPYEPPICLKIQMKSIPHMPKKCRLLHVEYHALAATRLLDDKESINASLHNPHPLDQEENSETERKLMQQANDDVKKIISLYEITGKIPSACVELSLFRKPYFLCRFLPALLKCDERTQTTDSKSKFIQVLHRAGKIPTTMYKEYETASISYNNSSLKRKYLCESPDGSLDLQELFSKYPQAVVDDSALGIVSGSKNIISEISKQLLKVFGSDHRIPDERVVFHPSRLPNISDQSIDVINQLLRAFGATLCSVGKFNCGIKWAENLLSACLAFTNLCEALYYRLWELIIELGSNLIEQHKWMLSVFLVHLRAMGGHVLMIDNINRSNNIVDAIIDAIPFETSEEMKDCFTIFSYYLQYTFLSMSALECQRSHINQQDYIPPSLIAKFSLVPQLYPGIENCNTNTNCPRLTRILYSSKQYKMIVAKFSKQNIK